MAYQENTALSPQDVIDKIATFASSNGWTVHQNTLSGSNRIATLKHASSDYVTLWNDNATDIRVRGHIGYVAGQNGDGQTSIGLRRCSANLLTAPYSRLYMFANALPAPHIYAVVEVASGVYRHIVFGVLEKIGAYTGGTFYDATNWSTSPLYAYAWSTENRTPFSLQTATNNSNCGGVRVDIPADGRSNAWASFYENDSYDARTGLSTGDADGGMTTADSPLVTLYSTRNNPTFSGTIALAAITVEVQRPSSFWSKIGIFPNVRYLSMARFNPGDEITIGSDVWKIFPWVRKGTGTVGIAEPYSNNNAFAYRKVA